MEPIGMIAWLGTGLFAGAVMNHHMRTKYRSLHIRGYWYHRPIDEAAREFDGSSLVMTVLSTLAGPAGLIATFLCKFMFFFILNDRTPWGLSLRFTPWTMEEALKEFPDDDELRRRANEIKREARPGLASTYENQV